MKEVQKQIAKPVPLMEFCHHVKNINEKLGLPDELPNITNFFTSDVYLAMEPRKQSFQNETCKVIVCYYAFVRNYCRASEEWHVL